MTRLVLKEELPARVSLEGLTPERLAGLSSLEIEHLPLQVGRRRERVGDWFGVASGDPAVLQIAGPGRRLDFIGAGMSTGTIMVEGDAGAYLGQGMTGGSIGVAGSAGYGAATALRGGTIRIAGDAGDALGGSLPGSDRGMRGGAVLVGRNVGARAGERLQRGLIAVTGEAGPGCGLGMIAGTILAGGAIGTHAGVAIRRGSIIALGGVPSLGPTFADCGVHDLLIVRLLARHLVSLGLGALAARFASFRRWAGDAAVGGRGEILVPP